MSNKDEKEGVSVSAMIIGVMILVAYFCWAMACSAYFGSILEVAAPEPGMGRIGGRGRGLALIVATILSFVLNSFRVNHAPGIIRNVFTSERWILVIFLTLMGAVVLFGLWVKKLETELAGPKRKSRRKRKGRRKRRPRPPE